MDKNKISIDGEAYEKLKSHKRKGENFSDVIKRLTGEKSWSEIAGIWKNDTEIEKLIEEGRKNSNQK